MKDRSGAIHQISNHWVPDLFLDRLILYLLYLTVCSFFLGWPVNPNLPIGHLNCYSLFGSTICILIQVCLTGYPTVVSEPRRAKMVISSWCANRRLLAVSLFEGGMVKKFSGPNEDGEP